MRVQLTDLYRPKFFSVSFEQSSSSSLEAVSCEDYQVNLLDSQVEDMVGIYRDYFIEELELGRYM